MKENIRRSGRLLLRSWRILLLYDILFKLLGTIVLFPACQLLFNKSLKLSGMYYVASQNFKTIGQYPLVITVLIFILFVFIFFTGFELNCLYLCFGVSWFRERLKFDRLMWEAFRRTVQLFSPRNWLLLIWTVFMIPGLSFFLFGSENDYTVILLNILRRSVLRQPGFSIAAAVAAAVAAGIIWLPLAFASYSFGGRSAADSMKESFRLQHRRAAGTLAGLIVFSAIVAGVFAAVVFGAEQAVHLFIFIFNRTASEKGMYLTVRTYINSAAASFAVSLVSVAAAAFLTNIYFRRSMERGVLLPPPIQTVKVSHWRNRAVVFISAGLVVTTVLVNTLSVIAVDHNAAAVSLFGEKLTITAHRGDSSSAPENTIPAFEAAIMDGADFVEMDVQLTSDGVPVIMHDDTCRRTCGVKKSVGAMTLEQVETLNAAYKWGGEYSGTKVPTLAEALECCRDRVKMVIELKNYKGTDKKLLAEKAVDLIESYGMEDQVVIHSFDYASLVYVKNIDPDIPCGYILEGTVGNYYDLSAADFFSVYMPFVTEKGVENVHLRGKKILVWTVDNASDMRECRKLGVDCIITDDPILARETIYGTTILNETIADETSAVFLKPVLDN